MEGGSQIQEAEKFGRTALLWASLGGHLSTVKWLLKEGGANIEDATNDRYTALLCAALRGELPTVTW
jgi:ankyrin repeat protein